MILPIYRVILLKKNYQWFIIIIDIIFIIIVQFVLCKFLSIKLLYLLALLIIDILLYKLRIKWVYVLATRLQSNNGTIVTKERDLITGI